VQLERLPDVSDIEYDKRFEEFDAKLRSLTSAIRTAKIKNRIPLSAPVKVTIRGPKDLLEFSKSIETDLMRTFRIEEISYQEGEALSVELSDHGSLSHTQPLKISSTNSFILCTPSLMSFSSRAKLSLTKSLPTLGENTSPGIVVTPLD